jgi:hypothetical protein
MVLSVCVSGVEGTPGFSAPHFRQAGEAGLADLGNASHLDNRRLFLPFCESSGLVMIRVGVSESFAVLVKHSRLPVVVHSPLVYPQCCGFPNFHLELPSR